MNLVLRSASLLALAAAAIAAHAQAVTYSFVSTTPAVSSFSVSTSTFITSTSGFNGNALTNPVNTTFALFSYDPTPTPPALRITTSTGAINDYLFAAGAFTSVGVKNATGANAGILTVTQAVPEPSALAALALPALGLLRRRRKA